MSAYKLICLDLDRTLLKTNKTIDKDTLKKLKSLEKQGVIICIATGRASFDAKKHAEIIGNETYYLASNGALIGRGDDVIYEQHFSTNQKSHLLRLFEEIKIKPIFVTSKHIYIYNIYHYIFHKLFYKRGQEDKFIKYVPDLELLNKIILNENCKVHKVNVFPKWKRKTQLLKDALKISGGFELAITPGNIFEITGQGISKGAGVKMLANHLNIALSDVIAFGDSQNDISMLETVGLGIAMSNAVVEVKKIADEITLDNNHNGVLRILNREYK